MKRAIERVEVSVNDFHVDFSVLPAEDPITLTSSILNSDFPEEIRETCIQRYHHFRTNYSRVSSRKGGNFVIRQPLGPDSIYLDEIHASILSVIKSLRPFGVRINLSFALILEDLNETDPLLRHPLVYASNNFQLFESARFITSTVDVEKLLDHCSYTTISDHLDMSTSSTKVRVAHIAAVLINAIVLPDAVQFGATSIPIPKFLCTRNIYVPPTANGFCLFYCLEDFFRGIKRHHAFDVFLKVKKLAKFYCSKVGRDFAHFNGSVNMSEFPQIESVFGINVYIFELSVPDQKKKKGIADLIYMSKEEKFSKSIYLNSYKGHLCHIRKIQEYLVSYRCPRCYKNFTRVMYLKQHKRVFAEKDCLSSTPDHSSSIGFRPSRTLEQELSRVGIDIPPEGLRLELFGTWDCESMLVKADTKNSKQREVIGRHSVVLISVASNVPGYEDAKVFQNFESEYEIVSQFLDYCRLMSEKAYEVNFERLGHILQKLDAMLDCEHKYGSFEKSVEKVREKLFKAMRRLRLFSCWGSRYDCPLIIALMLTYYYRRKEPNPYVVKAAGKFILLEDDHISMRDIASIQASSLDSIISCWGEKAEKLVFPFDLFESRDFLNYSGPFPSRESMTNKLKAGELPSESIYARSKLAYESICDSRMDLYFIHYAKIDVLPLVKAISRMLFYFYDQFKVNFLVDVFTISAMAITSMFSMISPRGAFIMAPSKPSEEFHTKLRKSICGGYSAIHGNIAIAGMTRIFGNDSPLHTKTIGYDANSLYAGILAGTLPTGLPLTWKLNSSGDFFVRQKSMLQQSSFAEWQYCVWRESQCQHECQHSFNGPQATFGQRNYKPDLFIPALKRIELFNGCRIHTHSYYDSGCPLSRQQGEFTPAQLKKIDNDQEAIKYYEDQGLETAIVWECQWNSLKANNPEIQDFLDANLNLPYQSSYRISASRMRELLMSKTVYGFVEFTAYIDQEHKEFYQHNLAPFIQKHLVQPSSLSPLQHKLCRQANIKHGRTQLIAATRSPPDMLVSTDFFVFLANLPGFKLQQIKTVYQMKPAKPFKNYIDKLVTMRKNADRDPNLAPLGVVAKLLANSSYGRTLIDRSCYTNTEYITERDYYKNATDPWLKTAAPLVKSGFWEIARRRRKYSTYSCPVIGATCLNNSKITLLSFAYFMLKTFNYERKQLRLLSLDTDSCYFSSPTEDLETILPESKAEEFHRLKPLYFALDASQLRQPLLFKIEKTSDNFVGLSPKNYKCWDWTSMEELKQCKTILEKLGIYAGPSDVRQLHSIIKTSADPKTAMKGVPRTSALKITGVEFLQTFLSDEPKHTEFYSIQRSVTTKEVLTLRQQRVALSRLSFKVRQTSVNSSQALF